MDLGRPLARHHVRRPHENGAGDAAPDPVPARATAPRESARDEGREVDPRRAGSATARP